MNKTRIGIVGAGWVAENRHLPALKAADDADVRWIWSRDPQRAGRVAAAFSIPNIADDWRQIATAGDVDAVVVATPPSLHAPVSIAALQAGKHVLCQGRMARNLAEARQMLDAALATNLVAALYPPRPGLKGDWVIRRLLRDQYYVGVVREVRVTGMDLAPEAEGYVWSSDPEVVGVNAMTLGMWAEVLHRWVGPATLISALAATHAARRLTPGGSLARAVIPDSVSVAGRLENGAILSCHFSNRAAFGPGHSIEIYGSHGALVYRLFTEELQGATAASDQLAPISVPPEQERQQTTDQEFVQAIRTGSSVSPGFEDGVRYMEFCEAVAISAATGQRVSLPIERPSMDSWGTRIHQ
jgi:predicted dehydrogenase